MKTSKIISKAIKLISNRASQLHSYLIVMTIGVAFSYNTAYSQIVPSSCSAPANIIEDYKLDAIQLTIRKLIDQNLPEKDSVDVPIDHRDTILDALIAVYNIDTPERDSVIEIFNTHAHQTIPGGGLIVYINSQFTITDPALDSIINKYSITYDESAIVQPPFILFNFNIELNQEALKTTLLNIEGVTGAEANYSTIKVTDIEAQVYVDHVELIYSYGWTDCVMGCWFRRFWKFKVYYDCSVEFVESYGDVYFTNNVAVSEEEELPSLEIYPNPASGNLNFTIIDNSNSIALEIFDVTGKNMKTVQYSNQGNGEFKKSIDVSDLRNGLYFCRFSNGEKQVTRKFVKE